MPELLIKTELFSSDSGNIAGVTTAMVTGIPGVRKAMRLGHSYHLTDGTSELRIEAPSVKLSAENAIWLSEALRTFGQTVQDVDASRAAPTPAG